jgi:hypothetical protein
VRQPHQPTVRVLTVSTIFVVWWHQIVRCRTEQVLCTVRCASDDCSDFYAQCSSLFTLQATVGADCCADWPLLRWCTGQSSGTPDSPVNYSGAALLKPEGGKYEVVRPWAPDIVRWCTGQSGVPDQGSLRVFLLLSFEP